jgi:hypothetical protein
MALQVEQALAAHVTDLFDFDAVQAAQARLEVLHTVHVALDVYSRGLVPMAPVELHFLAHRVAFGLQSSQRQARLGVRSSSPRALLPAKLGQP